MKKKEGRRERAFLGRSQENVLAAIEKKKLGDATSTNKKSNLINDFLRFIGDAEQSSLRVSY